MKRYVAWAERHWPDCKVQEILTDGGGEFENVPITAWYQQNGITHTPTPPNTSRLNIVERTHQTLTGMMKSMMKDSGFPTSFWVEALYYAVYIKNRVFSSPTNCTPFEEMWGRKPNIHHVRKFGALAYGHTKVGPSRYKFADNCRIGYVLGYRDGLLGCKVYFPSEGSVQVAGQVTVNEQIVYKDRHNGGFDRRVRDWVTAEHPDLTSAGRKDYDFPVVGGGSVDADSPHDIEHNSIPPQNGFPASGVISPWLHRKLPSFSDDVVLHPAISRTRNDRDNMQGNDIDVNKHRHADAASQKPPKARGDGNERRGGLIEVPDPDDEDISLEEMQVYAASWLLR
ncbi:unnamed protein product [Phytophthora fragariaefolia]|uniref:Unnamed protein product n=1 Tax=Phytophthora fragariaefolia TaxID=1490495 RepID=A0A9W6X675_9STRA|nr:unnamed protein product [Phytophthora fragariaefolia]